jgi:uncharacterized membrane protein
VIKSGSPVALPSNKMPHCLCVGSLSTVKSYLHNNSSVTVRYRRSKKQRLSGTWEVIRILLLPSVLFFHQTSEESPTFIIVKFAIIFIRLCTRFPAKGEFGKRVVDVIGQMCGCG